MVYSIITISFYKFSKKSLSSPICLPPFPVAPAQTELSRGTLAISSKRVRKRQLLMSTTVLRPRGKNLRHSVHTNRKITQFITPSDKITILRSPQCYFIKPRRSRADVNSNHTQCPQQGFSVHGTLSAPLCPRSPLLFRTPAPPTGG